MGVSIQHSFQTPEVATHQAPRIILQGWKEIASELDRGVRTVQRWEQSLGLPVHRLGKGPRCPVFAFKDELNVWFRNKAGECEAYANSNQCRTYQGISPPIKDRPEGQKSQASVLQSVSDFIRRERVRKKPQNCRSCESPLRFFEGHFSLYGTNMEWTIPIPYCPVCDAEILEALRQRPTIH
jgi:hypothetical protein